MFGAAPGARLPAAARAALGSQLSAAPAPAPPGGASTTAAGAAAAAAAAGADAAAAPPPQPRRPQLDRGNVAASLAQLVGVRFNPRGLPPSGGASGAAGGGAVEEDDDDVHRCALLKPAARGGATRVCNLR
jgi:hypothetical protein